MDYEEKYKEALKRAKYYKEGITDRKLENGENIMDYIFPELKESEDEKIKKFITHELACLRACEENGSDRYEELTNAIAWLEKQGKTSWKPSKEEMDVLYGLSYITNEFDERKEEVITQLYQDLKREFFNGASFENMFPTNTSAEFEKQGGNKHKFIIGDIISNNNIIYRVDNIVKNCIGQDCYFLVDIESENNGTRYLKLIDSKGKPHNSGETTWLCEQVDAKFEKQGKPKPTDKVQPKFKVGDWITNSIETLQITGYDIDYGYQVDYKGNLQHRDTDIIEKEYHFWTIQDAKDGDVLVTKKGNPFLYDKNRYNNELAYYYVGLDVNKELVSKSHHRMLSHFGKLSSISPATKKQCDLLFQKMKESGYEWDGEKKELRKIDAKKILF